MGKQFMRYGFGAIALYIVVAHGSDFGTAFSAGATGTGKLVNAFQGYKVG